MQQAFETSKERARRYYLTRKAKNPEREREYRERSRKKMLEKIHTYREQFLLQVSPERLCQTCGSKENLQLHHRSYNSSKEKQLVSRGGYMMTMKSIIALLDNPKRFRVLCQNCHRTLTMLLSKSLEVTDRLYQLSKEDRAEDY